VGQKRVTVVDLSQEEKEDQQQKVSQKRAAKAKKVLRVGKGTGRLADKGESIEDVVLAEEKPIEPKTPDKPATLLTEEKEKPEEIIKLEKKPRERSRRYKFARSVVDRTIVYPLDQAIELVKKASISRFDGTISAHLNLKDTGISADVPFPHPTGKQLRVAIATEALLKKIEKKKIDFDILLATPEMMPKITKLAKILGPKGLMPNPKNKTITDNPKTRKKELESGKVHVKSESKAPLMHVTVGKSSLDSKKLEKNIRALIEAVRPKNITKLTLASTMSPGVKVDLSQFEKINNLLPT
jgi:large subunit ribosomal protein L1